jgi:hypothetical protein
MLYPDRQAFFEKLALSLRPQPAIKIRPAPMPSGEHKQGLWIVRKAVPAQRLSHGATKHGVRQMIRERSKLDKVRSREPLVTLSSDDVPTRLDVSGKAIHWGADSIRPIRRPDAVWRGVFFDVPWNWLALAAAIALAAIVVSSFLPSTKATGS